MDTQSHAEAGSDRLGNLPVTLFGSVMGLGGLALAYLRAARVLGLPAAIGSVLLHAAAGWCAVLTVLYAIKLVRRFPQVRAEFQHPVVMNFFPAFSISLLILATGFLTQRPALARVLWYAGAALHLLLLLRMLSVWFHRPMHIQAINPAWFIPVVGTVIAPIAGVEVAGSEAGWFFFSIGILFWLALFAIVLYRIIFHDPLPDRLLPTLFILIAPPAVGMVASVRLNGSVGGCERVLFYFALFTLLMLVSMADRFRRVRFYVSWWAYTFPLDAIAIAALVMAHHTRTPFFEGLAWVLLGLATLVVAIVLVRTLIAAARREICVAEG